MWKNAFILLCLCIQALYIQAWAQDFCLIGGFERALPGDFVVVAINSQLSLLRVAASDENFVDFEEFTLEKRPSHIREWFMRNAATHPFLSLRMEKKSSKPVSAFTKRNKVDRGIERTTLDITPLATIATLSLMPISSQERRRVGGEGIRPIWNPPLYVDEKKEYTTFSAYHSKWPKDSTAFSQRPIVVYMPPKSTVYPDYLPYWVEIEGSVRQTMRVVDSGRGLL